MNIDERLEGLTERHEALTQTRAANMMEAVNSRPARIEDSLRRMES